MIHSQVFSAAPIVALSAFFTLVFAGCGESGPTYKLVSPITGKVMIGGQAVEGVDVSFQLQGSEPPGFQGVAARTDAQGNFEVVSGKRKGAPPGTYKVVFYKMVGKDGKPVVEDPDKGIDLGQLIATGEAKQLVPAIYTDPTTTTMEVTIEEGKPPPPLEWDLK